jgi:uncharacterized repeat protein (TIGR03803 family)
MRKLSVSKMVCIVFVFCAAASVASPAQTLTTLVNFAGANGGFPTSSLILGTDGNFYGTTAAGGTYGKGTVFQMSPQGTLRTLYSFCSQLNCADGAAPFAGLVQDSRGNFYGTTYSGGVGEGNASGTVFQMTPQGNLTTLYRFCSQPNCTDGAEPNGGLVLASDGNLYGTTYIGGNGTGNGNYRGTVYKITPSGKLTTLYSFCSQPNCTDGEAPAAGLVLASDGNFYGTTQYGGSSNNWLRGTVYKITPSGKLTTLYSFDGTDGAFPRAELVQAASGDLYGTASYGGTSTNCGDGGCGTVFKISTAGALSTMHSFTGPDGDQPSASLLLAADGNFYGTAVGGGSQNWGTVFKMTPGGALSTVYNFCSQSDCTDGAEPAAALVQGPDGNFYGTASAGGANQVGTVFRLSLASPSSPPLQFVPITRCRLLDTRTQYGGGGPIPGGTFATFSLPQLAENKGCDSLSSAAAYSLNVTVVPQGPLGYLTIWPAGQPQPEVSTLNSFDGRVKANAAIVQAGASAAVSVYVSNTTNVILDIDGYFTTPSQQTLQFYPLPPCRVADTRDPNQPQGLGPPYVSGGVPRDFPVLAASTCNIPSSAQAYSLNFTVVPHGFFGYLTVWPAGQNQPVVSTLNAYGGQYTANAAIVPAGTDGKVSTYALNDTELVIDINGYFAAPGQGGQSLYAVAPCRVLDTRDYTDTGSFRGTLSPPVDLRGFPCAVPSTAQAYVLNATVVPTGEMGYLTLWPDGMTQPIVSTLNALDGAVTSNMAIVPAGNQGQIDAYADVDTSLTDLILDIFSYFAP